ncbi:MAG TPA: hypothetical protein VJ729_11390 [Nitrososphaeraceae archaeon]|nr:hypothetical protein [Nitrososphaeraceae archaeon]
MNPVDTKVRKGLIAPPTHIAQQNDKSTPLKRTLFARKHLLLFLNSYQIPFDILSWLIL